MRYNGVELREVHPALSVAKEVPPGMPAVTNNMVEGTDGETLMSVSMARGEYVVYVNIAGKTRQEAWEARSRLAAWAMSSGGKVAALEPTWWPGRAYDAIIKEIEPPEFKIGFRGKIKVSFELPRPVAYDMILSRCSGTGKLSMVVGGTHTCRPVIRQTMLRDGVPVWSLGDQVIFALSDALSKGDVVEADYGTCSVTVNGVHAEDRVDYIRTDWQPGFAPGFRTVTSTDDGAMETEWHNEWV